MGYKGLLGVTTWLQHLHNRLQGVARGNKGLLGVTTWLQHLHNGLQGVARVNKAIRGCFRFLLLELLPVPRGC